MQVGVTAGQAVGYRPSSVPLYGVNGSTSYPLQCDANGNLTIFAGVSSDGASGIGVTGGVKAAKYCIGSACVSSWMPSIGTKMRQALARAEASNPTQRQQTPLTPAPAWVGNTAYILGQAVSNGGNVYICTTAGTSAASGGPSGTGRAAIADGSAAWYYWGSALVTVAAADSPVITGPSSVVGLSKAFAVATGGVVNPQFRISGANVVSCSSLAYTNCPSGVTGSGGAQGTPFKLSFVSDAPALVFDACMGGQAAAVLIVDGVPAMYGGMPATYSGGHCYARVDWSTTTGRKVRSYDVYSPGNATIGTVWVDPISKVWAPNPTPKIGSCWFGDSTLGGAIESFGYFSNRVAAMLGWSDAHNYSIGGTGFQASWTYAQHIADITTFGPCDVILFWGTYNDPAAGEQAAVLSTLQAARAQAPGAPIILFGEWPGTTGPSAAALSVEAASLAAFTQFADSNSFYVPVSNAPEGAWINGTGKVSAPNASGNSDLWVSADAVHPTPEGNYYLAQKIVNAVKNIIPQIQ